VLTPHEGKIEIPLDRLGFRVYNRGEGIKEALKYLGNADQMGTYYRTARIRKSARICRWVVELVGKTLSAPDRKLLREFEKLYDVLNIASYYRSLLADCTGQHSYGKRRCAMK
jgi:hypothetical protein